MKLFIRFALAKGAVGYGLELMMALFSVIQGMVSTIMQNSGFGGDSDVIELPAEMVEKIESVRIIRFYSSLDCYTAWQSVYNSPVIYYDLDRVWKDVQAVYVHSHSTHSHCDFCRRAYTEHREELVRSYAGVCMEGAIIALACIIFSVFAASPPAIADSSLSAVNIVWNYVAELIFNLLVLVGAIKAADRIVKEIMGL